MNSKGLYYSLVLAQTNQELDSLDDAEYPGNVFVWNNSSLQIQFGMIDLIITR